MPPQDGAIYENAIRYVPVKIAAKSVGLVPDYVSRMCRENMVRAKRHAGIWYVEEESLASFLKQQAAEYELFKKRKSLIGKEELKKNKSDYSKYISSALTGAALIPVVIALIIFKPNFSPSKQLASASTPGFFDTVALNIFHTFCPIFNDCGTAATTEVAGTSTNSSAPIAINNPVPPPAPVQETKVNPPPVQPSSPVQQPVQQIVQNITNPIRERIIEKVMPQTETSFDSVTLAQLDALESRIDARFDGLKSSTVVQPPQNVAAGGSVITYTYTPLASKIDHLDGITITNATIVGGSVSGVSGIPTSGSIASNFGQTFEEQNGYIAPTTTLTALFPAGIIAAASSSIQDLTISGNFSIGSGTGILEENAGVVSPLAYGSNGQVLKILGGVPTWGTDNTGNGGSSVWATTTDNLAVYTTDPTQTILVGNNATTTSGNILEVKGSSLLRGALTAYNTITAPQFVSTSTFASQFPYASSTAFSAGNLFANNLTISGNSTLGNGTSSSFAISNVANGLLKVNANGSILLAAPGVDYVTPGTSFSTSSNDYWQSQRDFFSTSSTAYWASGISFFSTTSADYLASQRNFFSTTSADFLSSQRNYFSTTSADYYIAANGVGAFSTSSTNYLLGTTDKGFFFSTTSTDYWKTANNFFSTTSNTYWASGINFFSTTSANYFADSSTTIAKTYANNSFGGTQTFLNASTTNISASYASTSALVISNIHSSLLKADAFGNVLAAIGGTDYANFAYLFPNNATTTLLAFNGGITFTNATGTSIFNQSEYALSAKFGATGTTTITSSGFIGIGTTTPGSALSVNGNSYVSATSTSANLVTNSLTIPQGTSQHIFNTWSPLLGEFTDGTAANPLTGAGPTFKISRTEQISSTTCNGNKVDDECNAGLAVYSVGTANSNMQTNAIFAGAQNSGTSTIDAVGLASEGRITGSGTGIGTGAYLEGRRDTSTGRALGAEIRVSNVTGTPGVYSLAGLSDTTGVWVSTSGTGGVNNAAGLAFGGVNGSKFLTGIGFTNNSIASTSIRDDSSSDTSIAINGTHTYALLAAAGSGNVGIGTAAPTSLLEVTGTSGVNPTVQIDTAALDTTGEFLRIGRTDNAAIRYQSLYAQSSATAANNFIAFDLHNGLTTTSQTEALRLVGNGNVGIGTTSPYAQLSVFTGSDYAAHTASTLFAVGSSTAGTASSTLFSINSAGQVSIIDGKNNTSAALNIGTGNILNFLSIAAGRAMFGFDTVPLSGTADSGELAISGGSTKGIEFFVNGTNNNFLSGTRALVITASSTVGIGTTSPAALFAVNGSSFFNGNITATGTVTSNAISTGGATSTSLFVNGSSTLLTLNAGNSIFNNATTTSLAITNLSTSAGQCLTIAANGAVTAQSCTAGGFAYLFPGNATTTGLGIYASSTIGDGTQTGGLTISGGATTTGNAHILGNLSVGTSTGSSALTFFTSGLTQGLNGTQYASGNAGAVVYPLNYLNINDSVNATSTYGFSVAQNVGGAGTAGNHIAIKGYTNINSPFTSNPTYSYYVGLWGFTRASINVGGTAGSEVGKVFGVNPQVALNSGATNYDSAIGDETDVEVDSGASVKNKIGLDITTIGTDAVQGSNVDAALLISSMNTSPGWNNGILFSRFSGGAPIAATGTLIGADTFTVTHGIDFSKVTCSSDCIKTPNFVVDGSGNIGFGTTTPNSPLFIYSPNHTLNNSPLTMAASFISSTAQGADVGSAISIGGLTDSNNTERNFGVIAGRKTNGNNADTSGYLSFSTNLSGTGLVEGMRLTNTGFVGIGSTSPSAMLDVAGNINIGTSKAYQIGDQNVLYASSTGLTTFGGIGAGAGIFANATSGAFTSGGQSTGFGYQAIGNATTSSLATDNNTAFGYQALRGSSSNFSNNENTAVGSQALLNVTTGSINTAIGYLALQNNTSGTNNLAAGALALSNNTSGAQNVALGRSALLQNITGTNNVAVGYSAGLGVAANSFSNNTLLGASAGRLLSTGSQNLLIGAFTGSTTATGANNIAIGYDVALPNTNGSNQLNIGNLLFGTGINGEGTTLSTGSIGIGTTSPGATFAIQGDQFIAGDITSTSTTASIFPYASTTAITSAVASSSLLYVNGLGGCSAGQYLTWSNGSFGCATDLTSSGAAPFTWSTTFSTLSAATSSSLWLTSGSFFSSSTVASQFPYASSTALTAGNLFATTANIGGVVFYNGSNLAVQQGAGTGAIKIGADVNLTTLTANIRKVGRIVAPSYDTAFTNTFLLASDNDGTNNRVDFGGYPAGSAIAATRLGFFTAAGTTTTGGTERMMIDSSGNVGIGTTTPASTFAVQGNQFIAGNITATSSVASRFPYASTTAITSSLASTTNLVISSLNTQAGQCLSIDATGNVIAQSCATGGFAYLFPNNATTTLLALNGGIIVNASSTIGNGSAAGGLTINGTATTTNLVFTGLSSTLLKVNAQGQVSAAVVGTDYANFGYLFPGNATTTQLAFNGGLTFTNATGTSLFTISLLASQAAFGATGTTTITNAGFLGVGTSSPYRALAVVGTTTSSGGFNVDTNANLLSFQGSTTISVKGTRNFFAGLGANGSTTKSTAQIFDSVFMGNMAGYNSTRDSNVFIGSFAGAGSSTGASNNAQDSTAVGAFALQYNSSGSDNNAFGYQTLQNNTTGFSNNAFGFTALLSNTTGSDNNAFGDSSLAQNSTGGGNSAFGTSALSSNSTGDSNTAVGSDALFFNNSGSSNTAVGVNAVQHLRDGNENIGIGDKSLDGVTDGSYNIGIGYNTLCDTDGTSTIALGDRAGCGFSNTDLGSIYIGSQTAWNLTGATQFNTYLGYQTGFNLVSGYGNLLIGASSSANLTAGSNNLALGNNTNFASSTGSNQLNIGNLLFGTIPATSTGFQLPISGTLGIGTSTPFGKFAISLNNGDSGFYNNAFTIASSTALATTTLFSIANSGTIKLNLDSSTSTLLTFAGRTFATASTTSENTSFGINALAGNTGGFDNTAFGYGALIAATSTSGNVAFGDLNLQNVFGNNNTAIGSEAALGTITGDQNIAIGALSVGDAITGFDNIGIGYHTFNSRLTGLGNVALGSYSSEGQAALRGDYNVTIGYKGGQGLGGPNGDNVIIGGFAGNNIGNFDEYSSNNIIIGYNVQAPKNNSVALSNVMNIGNILMGTLPATTTFTQTYRQPFNGTIGIGTTSATSRFGIQANNKDTLTTLFQISSSTANSTTTLFSINNTGTASTTNLVISSLNSSAGQCLTIASNGAVTTQSCTTGGFAYLFPSNATSTQLSFTSGINASSTSNFDSLSILSGATTSALFVNGSSTLLTLNSGNAIINNATTTSLAITGIQNAILGTDASGNVIASSSLTINSLTVNNNTTFNGRTTFALSSTTNLSVLNNAWFGATATSTFTSAGLLGIGSSTPYGALTIQATNGTTYPGNYLFNIASSTSVGTANIFRVTNAGQVVIGGTAASSSPVGQFSIFPNDANIGGIGSSTIQRVAVATLSVGSTGGPQSVYVQGRYAYVTSLSNLEIWDVSNPQGGIFRVSTSALKNVGGAIVVQGRYAYLADETTANSFEVWDVSNPAAPVRTSFASFTSTGININVQGRYAYVLTNGSFEVWDVGNPYTVVRVTNIPLSSSWGMTIQGRYAYVLENLGNLEIFDISNPLAPIKLSTKAMAHTGRSIFVQGRYAYVGETVGGFEIYDVSNPASIPNAVYSTNVLTNSGLNVYVQGRYAYIGTNGSTNGFEVWDIASSTAPSRVAVLSLNGGALGMYVNGRYAYFNENIATNSFEVFDLGGAYIQQLETGGLETGVLSVRNSLSAGDAAFSGSVAVGSNLNLGGTFNLVGSTFNATTTNQQSFSLFNVTTASSSVPSIFNVAYNGAVGIGTSTATSSTPLSKFTISLNASDTVPFANAFLISSSSIGATTTLFSISNTGLITGQNFNFQNGTTSSLFVNGSSTINILNANNATIAFASTTAITSSVASTSLLYVNGLGGCSAGQYLTWANGSFGCATDQNSSASVFSFSTNFATNTAATTTSIWTQGVFFSSSTVATSTFQGGLSVGNTGTFSVFNNGVVNFNPLAQSGDVVALLGGQNFISATTSAASGNLSIGYQAGQALLATSSGAGNTAFGYQALAISTSSSGNTAIGYKTLANVDDFIANNNTAVGYEALNANTTGSSNSAFGNATLSLNTSGNNNNAFGILALEFNSTGNSNNVFGTTAGLWNRSGSGNSAFGDSALLNNGFSTPGGSNNSVFGFQAGYSIDGGYSNTLIGDNTTQNNTVTRGGGNIGLGSNIFFASTTANRQLNIGNLLFGTLPATSTGFQLPTSGSIGIGTTSPFGKFAISLNNGDTSFSNNAFTIASSTASATTTLFQITNSGGVLHDSPTYQKNQFILANGLSTTTAPNYPVVNGLNALPELTVESSETNASRPLWFGYNNNGAWDAFMTVGACGSFSTMCLDFNNGANTITALKGISTALVIGGGSGISYLGGGVSTVDNSYSDVVFGNTGNVSIMGGGNLGIGTSSPYARFSLLSNASSTATTLFTIASTTWNAGAFSTTTLFSILNTGVIRSGGDSTNSLILQDGSGNQVFRGARAAGWLDSVTTQYFQVGDGAAPNIFFTSVNGSRASRTGFSSLSTQITSASFNTSNAPSGIFEVSNGQAGIFNVQTNGNVGIGTTSPYALLSVVATSTNGVASPQYLFAVASTTGGTATSTLFAIGNNGSFDVGTSSNTGFHLVSNAATAGNGLTVTTSGAGSGVTISATNVAGAADALTLSSANGGGINFNTSGATRFSMGDGRVLLTPANATTNHFQFTGPVDTALTASTEISSINFDLKASRTHSNGALSLEREFLIQTPTLGFTSFSNGTNVITDAATLGIAAGPRAGTNATTTNSYALLIGSSTASTMYNASTTNSYGLAVFTTGGAQNTYSAIFNGGNVGVGTTSPWALLSVNPDGLLNNAPQFAVGSSSATSFVISNNGRIGINSVPPFGGVQVTISHPTSVDGIALFPGGDSDKEMVFHNAAGASVGSITENGSNTAYNTSSDRRIKENIATTTLGLDQLMNLPVRSFAFISDPTHATTTGFIAQELYQVFPWAVTPNGDDGSVPLSSSSTPWAVDYGRITPLIVKSVQDLNAKVDSNASSSVRIHDGLITLSLSSATTTIATGTNVWNIATSSATGTIPIISISAPASSTPSVSINGNLYLRGINIGDIMASATATTSTGYFTDANGPFASVSAALKDALNAGLNSISSATQSGVRELGLAVHASVGIFDNIFAKTITADNVEAQTVTADQKLCIGHTCVTEAQLQELLGAQSASAAASTPSGSGSQNSSSTPPVITVNGNNPATVHVGDTYNDLGATISGPQDDLNLGIQASVDNATSTPVADISVDTTQTGTHTIVYSATDQNGLVGTVSRTVNVIDTGSTTSTSPVSDATSTSATSTTP